MMKAVSLHDKLRDLPKLYLIIYSDAEKLTPVTAELSSTHYHFAATVCIDGELKARHKLCHSKKEEAPWLALDYGEKAQVSVEKVLLYNRFDGSFERTKDVQIRICNELPNSGKTMATCGEALGTFKGPATKGQIVEIHSGSGWEKKTGRYLIVQMNMGKGGNYLNLHEVQAVGISHVATSKGKMLPILHTSNFLAVEIPNTPLSYFTEHCTLFQPLCDMTKILTDTKTFDLRPFFPIAIPRLFLRRPNGPEVFQGHLDPSRTS